MEMNLMSKTFHATLIRTGAEQIHRISLDTGGFHGASVCAPPKLEGYPGCTTPHQLFLAAVGSCVNIIFEMACSKARVEVLDLTSNIRGDYETEEKTQRSYFTSVVVDTTITVPKDTKESKVQRLFQIATTNCPIGNSLQNPDCSCVDLNSKLTVKHPKD